MGGARCVGSSGLPPGWSVVTVVAVVVARRDVDMIWYVCTVGAMGTMGMGWLVTTKKPAMRWCGMANRALS